MINRKSASVSVLLINSMLRFTDPDKPRCVSVCPEDYFLDDEITIKGIKMCVPSCNKLRIRRAFAHAFLFIHIIA